MLQSAASEARPKLRGQDPGTIIFSHGHVPQIVVPISLAKWDESSECNLDYAFPSHHLDYVANLGACFAAKEEQRS